MPLDDEIQHWIENNQRLTEHPILTKLIQEGCLGKKTLKGFNLYYENGSLGNMNPSFKDELIKIKNKIPPKKLNIIDRFLFRSLNECLGLIEEKVVTNEEILDLVSVSIGYPPDSGGICSIFRHWKPSDIVEKMKEFETEYGSQFKPSPLLLKREKFDRLFTDDKVVESTKKTKEDIVFSNFPTPKQLSSVWTKWTIFMVVILGFVFFNFFVRYNPKYNPK
jgi:3-hydroxyacyl-CoA dehydrogenase